MHEWRAVMSICESSRTSMLKVLRVRGWLTSLWTIKMIPTTKFISFISFTTTLTPNNGAMTTMWPILQNCRTSFQKFSPASNNGTHPFTCYKKRNKQKRIKNKNVRQKIKFLKESTLQSNTYTERSLKNTTKPTYCLC